MSVTPPCIVFMYQREKYDTCCKFLFVKRICLNEERGSHHDKHLNICTVFLFPKQKSFHVSVSIMSVKKTGSHLFRDFSIQQIPVAATVQVEMTAKLKIRRFSNFDGSPKQIIN